MKKKLIAIIMALALVLTLTPMVYALADSGGTGGEGGDGTPDLTTPAAATEQAVIQVGTATVGTQGTMGATGTVNVKVVMPTNDSLNGVGSFTVQLDFDETKLQIVSEGTEIPEIGIGETAYKPVTTNLADGDTGELNVTASNTDGYVTSNLGSPDSKGETADSNKENRLQLSGATVLDVTFKAKDEVTLNENDELTFTLTECQVTKHVAGDASAGTSGGSTTYLMQLVNETTHPATLYKAIDTNTVKVVAGFEVSGTVESYNPGNVTTIRLYANTDTSHANALHTGTIEATTGSGKKTQTFTIPTVQAGTYDLVVSKPSHLDYTIKGVEVNSDLNLTASTNDAVKMITLLCGDIDGNKSINFADYEKLLNPTNYDKNTTDAGVESKADLDGNGKINFADYEILLNPTNYDKKEVSVKYSA